MAYVRKRGSQLVIVQGERESQTGEVQQRILFTIYSKAEAQACLLQPKTTADGPSLRGLLESEYPDISFNWNEIRRGIQANIEALPDSYEYRGERLRRRFREDLCAFTRQLVLADPQDLASSANVIEEHRHELEYLADLIAWRLKLRQQPESEWNRDNAFFWRFALRGREVPPDTEEEAAAFYERGEYDRARAIFGLLVDSFEGYAEGYNYLGLIALEQRQLTEAEAHFRKTIEVGRTLFPRRISRQRYWTDHATRPYMRGLSNLAMTLNQSGQFGEALAICDQLVNECGDESSASQRVDIFLNMGNWIAAASTAKALLGADPSAAFVGAFASFELNAQDQALPLFLHAALKYPRAAHMLVGVKTGRQAVRTSQEAEDHNAGVHLARGLHTYLGRQSARSRKWFKAVLNDARVKGLLKESAAVVDEWRAERGTGQRNARERMHEMRSWPFAQAEARKLSDLLSGASTSAALH